MEGGNEINRTVLKRIKLKNHKVAREMQLLGFPGICVKQSRPIKFHQNLI